MDFKTTKIRDETSFEFLYDENNHPVGFWYKQGSGAWNLYFYVTNLQGDITKIIDENGSSIGTYVYDAWGKVTSISGIVAQANPLRYRGYYFDQETGFYHLGSRYYDPEIGRFLSADEVGLLGANGEFISYNLFAYCLNNPVKGIDSEGTFNTEGVLVGLSIVAVTTMIIVTGGIATPMAGVVATAMLTTGTVMVEAAATDAVMVLDLSVSAPFMNGMYMKAGSSLVVDFAKSEINAYEHMGGGAGKNIGPSYSVGIIENYEKPEDYSKHFVGVNCGFGIGCERCNNPLQEPKKATRSTSISFSMPGSANAGLSYDYYSQPHKILSWRRMTE